MTIHFSQPIKFKSLAVCAIQDAVHYIRLEYENLLFRKKSECDQNEQAKANHETPSLADCTSQMHVKQLKQLPQFLYCNHIKM